MNNGLPKRPFSFYPAHFVPNNWDVHEGFLSWLGQSSIVWDDHLQLCSFFDPDKTNCLFFDWVSPSVDLLFDRESSLFDSNRRVVVRLAGQYTSIFGRRRYKTKKIAVSELMPVHNQILPLYYRALHVGGELISISNLDNVYHGEAFEITLDRENYAFDLYTKFLCGRYWNKKKIQIANSSSWMNYMYNAARYYFQEVESSEGSTFVNTR